LKIYLLERVSSVIQNESGIKNAPFGGQPDLSGTDHKNQGNKKQ
jgi:hypothetical protein